MAHLPFEIIEIGAVRLDENMVMTGEFHRLIKPQVYRRMHYAITEVTHMDMAELCREGVRFADAMTEFMEWCGEEPIFCTWGSQDLTELQKNMTYYHMDIPWPMPLLYYDIQKLFCLLYGDGKQKQSLDLAVEVLALQEDRPFHRALDDAYYTGKVLMNLDFEQVCDYLSMDYYRLPRTSKEEVKLIFPSYMKYVSREFEDREHVMRDRHVAELPCSECSRLLRKKLRWFTANQKIYLGLGYCPEHGYVKGKIRIKKAEDGGVFAVRTTKLVSTEGVDWIYAKKEEIRRKRREKRHQA